MGKSTVYPISKIGGLPPGCAIWYKYAASRRAKTIMQNQRYGTRDISTAYTIASAFSLNAKSGVFLPTGNVGSNGVAAFTLSYPYIWGFPVAPPNTTVMVLKSTPVQNDYGVYQFDYDVISSERYRIDSPIDCVLALDGTYPDNGYDSETDAYYEKKT